MNPTILPTIPIETVEGHLTEIVKNLPPGDEITLTSDDKPVAILRGVSAKSDEAPKFGTLAGTIVSLSPDFDAIPEGFEDYLP